MTTHSTDATTPALEVPTLARRYGVAVSVVALALLMTLAIPPVRNESPTALFFAAVMVSSWYGGLGAGLLATALATGAINSFTIPPVYAVVLGLGEIVRIGVFVLVALLISALNASRRRLGEALLQRAVQLAEADRRKDEFLATLAHELRNPLAAIGGALEALRLGRGDSAEAVKTWGIIDRQARQMARLTDDLLDASRITRGAITLRKEEVDLGTVIAHAVETAQGADRRTAARAVGGSTAGAGSAGSRFPAVRAGPGKSVAQRRQVHRIRWPDLAGRQAQRG